MLFLKFIIVLFLFHSANNPHLQPSALLVECDPSHDAVPFGDDQPFSNLSTSLSSSFSRTDIDNEEFNITKDDTVDVLDSLKLNYRHEQSTNDVAVLPLTTENKSLVQESNLNQDEIHGQERLQGNAYISRCNMFI